MARTAVIFLIAMVAACAGGVRRPSDPRQVVFAESLAIDLAAMTRTSGGVYYADRRAGDGEEVRRGRTVQVLYTGWLPDGTIFDASRDAEDAVQFRIGEGQVIPGWEEGLVGMRVGGLRRLVVPPSQGYGPRRVGSIPANATLVFEILIMAVR